VEVVCEGCGAKLSVPDDKLPASGTAQATCPRCKGKIIIGARPEQAAPPPPPAAASPAEEHPNYSSDLLERFEGEGPAALVLCEGEAGPLAEAAVASLGYRVGRAATVAEAQAKIKFNAYDLVVLDARFGAQQGAASPVLDHLNTLPMSIRRHMFVALVGPGLATLDRMAAFVRSVNLTVSEADLPSLDKVLKNSVAEHELFYRVLDETLRAVGRT
jgi:DNA-directed RNA polymerase subunit RPC12/RpoP